MKVLVWVLLLSWIPTWANEFFVAPDGRARASGSVGDPWDLATALAHPPMVAPGDTIWMRGGTYKGIFVSRLAGASNAPITLRAYRGERPVLDQGALDPENRSNLTIFGRFTWFWGLEITNSEPTRVFPNSFDVCPNHQHCRPEAVTVFGPGTRVINCIIHDAGGGIGLWSAANDSEAYGNIVFFIGWQGRNGGAGHSIYAQNRKGTAKITDNVLFSGFHSGIHVYGSSDAFLRNFEIEGNTIFSTGLLGEDPSGWGILVGGNVRAENITVSRNYIYNPDWYRRSNNLNPSYGVGTTGLVLEENYSVGYKALGSDVPPTNFRSNSNTLAGFIDPPLLGLIRGQTSNQIRTLESLQGSANKVFVRRNRYEPDLATVTVFNWKGGGDAELDLSTFLKAGDNYEVVDIQDLFKGPVASGTYEGKAVKVPMHAGTGKPNGAVPGNRYRTGNEFGVFQVRIVKGQPQTPKRLRSSLERLRFTQMAGSEDRPSPQILGLSTVAEGESLEWKVASVPNWLRTSHENGSLPDRVEFSVDASGLEPGTYESEVVLEAGDAEPLVTPVTLTVLAEVSAPVVDLIANRSRFDQLLSPQSQLLVLGSNLTGALHMPGAATFDQSDVIPGEPRIEVNGKPARLIEVSPYRLIALPPPSLVNETGPVEITVRTAEGVTTSTVNFVETAVGLIEVEGKPGLVRAEHADGGLVAMEPDESTGVRPARPGDTISVYSTGLFPVPNSESESPGTLPGDRVIEVLIGGLLAQVANAALISPGLAQVSVVVPDAPEGRQAMKLRYAGAESQMATYLPISR